MTTTISELLNLREVATNVYESTSNPEKMGNPSNIAYGGCAMGCAVNAAYKSLPNSKLHLYSAVGHYLGPTFTDQPIQVKVTIVRDTKTFSTRQLEVSQMQNSLRRNTLIMIADFMILEEPLLTYSEKPMKVYSDADQYPSQLEVLTKMIKDKVVPSSLEKIYKVVFGLKDKFFDNKICTDGVFGQNVNGLAKTVKTTQDHLHITEKTSGDFFKSKVTLNTEAENVSAFAFMMDGALPFVALSHNHQFFDDAGACSSLDFSLRLFSSKINLNKWVTREMHTRAASEGRTFAEANVWDEDGNIIATMSQQGILRVKPVQKSKL